MLNKFHLDKKVAIGFILSLIVLVVLTFFFFQSMRRLTQTSRLLTHGLSVISQADLIVKSAVDVETSQRGFVITGNETFLEPYNDAEEFASMHFSKLDSLTQGDSLQFARVDSLKTLIIRSREFATQSIAARRASFENARELIKTGHGKALTDSIRSLVKRIQEEEGRTFRAKNTITSKSFEQFLLSFVALAASIAIIIVILFYAINRTLGRRRLIERDLSKNLSEKEDLYDNAPCGYFSFNADHRVTNVNKTMADWLGYSRTAILNGMKVEDIVVRNIQSLFTDTVGREGTRELKDLDVELCRKDNSTFPVIINTAEYWTEEGLHIESRASVVDNSERRRQQDQILLLNQELEKKVEQRTSELARSVHIYKSIAANIPGSSIVVLDKEGRYILAEGDLLAQLGYDKHKMIDKKLDEVAPAERVAIYQQLIAKAFEGQSVSREIEATNKRQTLIKVAPLRNEEREIFGVIIVMLDITEVKAAQSRLEELNESLESKVNERTEQLVKANKELESFSYSVSHDLRAPLRAVNGYARILEEDYNTLFDDDGRRYLGLVIKNGIRMDKLIDDLLTFSRLGRKELAKSEVNMTTMVTELSKEMKELEKGRNITISMSALLPALADYSMIRQVWQNLLSNAIKYSQHRTETQIEVGCFTNDHSNCYFVRDNGAGFDMTYYDKLFGVFQRLHKINEFDGTGVGLAIVKTVVERHGGEVWAESEVNQGATFFFSLPH